MLLGANVVSTRRFLSCSEGFLLHEIAVINISTTGSCSGGYVARESCAIYAATQVGRPDHVVGCSCGPTSSVTLQTH